MIRHIFVAAALAVAGCAGVSPQAADPAVTARIAGACTASGLFVLANGVATSAIPVPGLAIAGQLVDAGVEKVCAHPEQFAGDIATVEWLNRQFAAAVQKRFGK